MKDKNIQNISRRGFVKNLGLTSGGLILAGYFPSYASPIFKLKSGLTETESSFEPNLFIHMSSDGHTTILVTRSEMGQGVRTSISSIIADEMDADWQYISVKQAQGDKKYGNQNTDGSRSIRTFFKPMREMGANARALLIKAAAQKWNAHPEECTTENHYVIHVQSGQKAFYGDLTEAASSLEIIENAPFKDHENFKYIGKNLKSVDVKDFTRGKANYGMDIKLPGMKYATIQRCPVTFGTIKHIDKANALVIKDVTNIFELERVTKPFGPLGGVVVVANNTWAAIKGKEALNIEWDYGNNKNYNSETYKAQLIEVVNNPGVEAKKVGDVNKAFEDAHTTIEANYYLPHLVHAPMEVPNATADVKDGRCEIWAPVQDPQSARREVAEYLDIPIKDVIVNVTFLGGGFGRKSKPDFVVEAAAISNIINAPVQLVWTREDDIQNSYYHTVNAQYLKGSLDNNGKVTGWLHRSAFPTIMSTFEPGANYAASWEMGQGVTKNGFQISNILCENGKAPAHVRIGWLRSVCDLFHSFGINVFADELAAAANKDPLEFMLALIGDDRKEDFGNSTPFYTKRLKHVLKTAAKNANWGKKLPKGYGQGLTVHYSFQSYVASIAEVSVINNKLKVHSIHTVIDCGTAVNKNTIAAQMEGSANFGLSAILYGNITAKNGAIEQSNFHDYKLLRMLDAPDIHVDIINNNEAPTGVGEPGLPVIAPAIINAIFEATGKRYRELPLTELL